MGILELLFAILIFTFTFGEVIRFSLSDGIFLKPTDLVLVILIITWLAKVIREKTYKIFDDNLSFPTLLFIVIALASLFVNAKYLSTNEFLVSFSYLIRWTIYAGLYYVVKTFSFEYKKKAIYIFAISGCLIVLFGFIQYFFYSNLRNVYYLGWDDHMYRLFSTFLDPNFAGAFLVFYLIFTTGLFLHFLKTKQKKFLFGTSCIFLLTLTAIYLTFSRSALIMLLLSFLAFSVFAKKMKWVLRLILISIIFFLISAKNFNIENRNLFRIASTEARLESAKTTIQIIKDNPILGVGFNTYRYAQIRYGFRRPEGALESHADAGSDNSFLFILATTGIIGLLSYLYLLFAILKNAYINYSILRTVVIASLVGIIADSFFINSLFYSLNMMWIWILVGYSSSTSSKFRENK